MKTAPCRDCGATWHTRSYHTQKQRKPLQTTTPLRAKSYMKPGTKRIKHESTKHRTKRQDTTTEWFKQNGSGPWPCYLQVVPDCLRTVTRETINLEHKMSKVRHPELRYDVTNLGPACSPCNAYKGSRDYINGELV